MRRLELRGVVITDLTPQEVAEVREQLDAPERYQRTGLLSAAEAAKRLGVSREFVYSHAEELGGTKVGSVWRFPAKLSAEAQAPEPSPAPTASSVSRRRKRNRGALLEVDD